MEKMPISKHEARPEYLRNAGLYYPDEWSFSEEFVSYVYEVCNKNGIVLTMFPLSHDPGYPRTIELKFANGPWYDIKDEIHLLQILENLVNNF